jgi:hypothetical protein
MEQTNLVVTGDGKTWDEVTRDVSYIGDTSLQLNSDDGQKTSTTVAIMDECRGFSPDNRDVHHFNKDFAIAYDRQICLKDGEYEFTLGSVIRNVSSNSQFSFKVNGLIANIANNAGSDWSLSQISGIVHLKRGDYVQVFGGAWVNNDVAYNSYHIRRLK